MLALVAPREPFVQSQARISARMQLNFSAEQNLPSSMMIQKQDDSYSVLIPGLPEDLAKICLALVPRSHFAVMSSVSKSWMAFIGSREFIAVRKETGKLEEWIYVLTAGSGGQGSRWEVLGSPDQKKRILPPMPGPRKAGFGVVVLDGKLFVMAGYAADHGKEFVSDEVYLYDACLNRSATATFFNKRILLFSCSSSTNSYLLKIQVDCTCQDERCTTRLRMRRGQWCDICSWWIWTWWR